MTEEKDKLAPEDLANESMKRTINNAMRAVVERGLKCKNDEYPPIEVLIVSGEHNVTIRKVGFRIHVAAEIWRRMYTYLSSPNSINMSRLLIKAALRKKERRVPKSTTPNAFTGELNSRRPYEQNSANHILTYVAIGQFQYRDLQVYNPLPYLR
ncbi:hypothetical protein ACTXT7_009822 [Hymenolepis weldensis]